MKIECWFIGKTNENYLSEGIAIFLKRLKRYVPIEVVILPDIKQSGNADHIQLKKAEAQLVEKRLKPGDMLILLDEKGSTYSSEALAARVNHWLNQPGQRLIFLVAGAYGADAQLKTLATEKLSLSQLTFSHQMVRLFFMEQLYRAMTILHNEPYHNP
ncbi:MAG: 23S rRNA (pseudouridine(1915)-N(3))-methyltransferase RlmH [Saprospiraceae bacterium]|jgi:23S rRNA (pseudouridine1915-N3)-methyltransferase|nr:23S rRNA (pseudouridine(1915)-N(3))-methyltransferase RlmH [Saprospiraceae bacterium]MDP4822247.1 23S rRNA (pseudouridine(1915)-N(3))-methyltransferase RlmH [Saprospiraceae bacterium]MDP4999189.1 23S rRNA (pseudouridine(1915)-N(3))-methyltransferase RlmH [Saprospiraceae bacterium]